MRRKSIAVLGTFTRDTTVYLDGSRSENLGGLLYTVLTLGSLLDGRLRILPVANIGHDAAAQIRTALDLPGVDLAAVRTVPVPNNHVYLRYTSPEERDEVLVGLVPPVGYEHCRVAADVDWFVVNMTSGRDIELDTLRRFRATFTGTIQFDIHSLTLGFDAAGKRVMELPRDWEQWVACVDWVQMNEAEAKLLGAGAAPEALARRILGLGPRGVFITLGSRGCVAAVRGDAGAVHVHGMPAAQQPQPAFPTGCGDVFGASFACAMLFGAAPLDACAFANAVAGRKASFEPFQRLRALRQEIGPELERFLPHAL